jgi:hypothetical protein
LATFRKKRETLVPLTEKLEILILILTNMQYELNIQKNSKSDYQENQTFLAMVGTIPAKNAISWYESSHHSFR